MALRRIYYEKAIYHVISRGNNRYAILKHAEDKIMFLQTIAKQKARYQFKLFGFVLMDNHIHLVIEASSCYSISRIMQSILLSYSRKYRNRYKYVGHLWQGRFISKPIMGEKYILECLEYIHNNPVRAQLIDSPDHYIWSSARFYEKLDNAQVQEYIDIDDYGHFCHN